jgi:hypothetical protein
MDELMTAISGQFLRLARRAPQAGKQRAIEIAEPRSGSRAT